MVVGSWLVGGSWLLVGCWLLVVGWLVGCWLLVLGWLLVLVRGSWWAFVLWLSVGLGRWFLAECSEAMWWLVVLDHGQHEKLRQPRTGRRDRPVTAQRAGSAGDSSGSRRRRMDGWHSRNTRAPERGTFARAFDMICEAHERGRSREMRSSVLSVPLSTVMF